MQAAGNDWFWVLDTTSRTRTARSFNWHFDRHLQAFLSVGLIGAGVGAGRLTLIRVADGIAVGVLNQPCWTKRLTLLEKRMAQPFVG